MKLDLDLLRDNLRLTDSKKGCDHRRSLRECGAWERSGINLCLTFTVMHAGQEITILEGLA